MENDKKKEDPAVTFARKVVQFFENEGNFNKAATVKHFLSERRQGAIYRVLKKYEKNGNKLLIAKKRSGRKRTAVTEENIQKFEELYKLDPEVTCQEAAHIINVPIGSMRAVRKKMLQRLFAKSNSNPPEEESISSEAKSQQGHELFQSDAGRKEETSSTFQEDSKNIPDKPPELKVEIEENQDEQFFEDGPMSPFSSDDYMISPTPCKSELVEESFSLGLIKNDIDDSDPIEEPIRGRGRLRPRRSLRKPVPLSMSFNAKRKVPVVIEETVYPPSCLFCFKENISPIESLELYHEELALNANARVILLLKTLEIPSEELASFMKKSKGKHPSEWIVVCTNCLKWMEEAEEIHRQIKILERKLSRWRYMVETEIRSRGKSLGYKYAKAKKIVLRRVQESIFNKRVVLNSESQGDFETNLKLKKIGTVPKENRSSKKIKVEEDSVTALPEVDFGDDRFSDSEECQVNSSLNDSADQEERNQPAKEVVDMETGISGGENETQRQNDKVDNDSSEKPTTISEIKLQAKLALCDICSDEIRPMAMPMHQLKEHGVVMEGYTLKKCSWEGCKYVTFYDFRLQVHTKKHGRPRPFACPVCDKRFMDKPALQLHEEIHKNAETRPHQCELCGKSYAVSTYLYIHKRTKHKLCSIPWKGKKRQVDTSPP